MRHARTVGASLLAVAAMVGILLALTAQVPPGKLPGLVSADPFVKGCVDCHKLGSDGKDSRLTVELKKNSKHPDISAIVKTVPTDCAMCHKAGTTAGPIGNLTHRNHYQAKGNGDFVRAYGGECLSCHSVDAATFQMKVKSSPKNW